MQARLLALSAQVHNPIRGNDQIYMDITTESSNPCESSTGSDTLLFGEIEWERSNKEEVIESNNFLNKLESVCDIEDRDSLAGAKIEVIKRGPTPQ